MRVCEKCGGDCDPHDDRGRTDLQEAVLRAAVAWKASSDAWAAGARMAVLSSAVDALLAAEPEVGQMICKECGGYAFCGVCQAYGGCRGPTLAKCPHGAPSRTLGSGLPVAGRGPGDIGLGGGISFGQGWSSE